MRNANLFVLSMTVTTGLFVAHVHLDADAGAGDPQPLASPVSVALAKDCEITGRIERRDDGIYLAFEATNPTDESRTVDIHFAAHCTPGSNPMSRMVMTPMEINRGCWSVELAAGESTHYEVLAQATSSERPSGTLGGETTQLTALTGTPAVVNQSVSQVQAIARLVSPETWTLTVALTENIGAVGWGASLPGAALNKVNLDKGQVVLARTVTHVQSVGQENAG